MKTEGLVALAVYLGIGALLHALMVGPHLDWWSAATWGWLIGWPAAVAIAFWGLVLGVAALGAVVVFVVWICLAITGSRRRVRKSDI
jgi:hypothetical protein